MRLKEYILEAVSHGRHRYRSSLTDKSKFEDWYNAISRSMDIEEKDEGQEEIGKGRPGGCTHYIFSGSKPPFVSDIIVLYTKKFYYFISFTGDGFVKRVLRYNIDDEWATTFGTKVDIEEINDLLSF